MGALDATTGATLPWAATNRIKSAGLNGAISSLSTDGIQVYGSGYAFGAGPRSRAPSPRTPTPGQHQLGERLPRRHLRHLRLRTRSSTRGPPSRLLGGRQVPRHQPARPAGRRRSPSRSFRSAPSRRRTPTGGTSPDCRTPACCSGSPTSTSAATRRTEQAAWSVTGNSTTTSSSAASSRRSTASPSRGWCASPSGALPAQARGPIYTAGITPTLDSTESGIVRIRWTAPGTATTTTSPMTCTAMARRVHRDLHPQRQHLLAAAEHEHHRHRTDPGQTHTYQVRAKDSDGNVQWSASSPVTVSGTATSTYPRRCAPTAPPTSGSSTTPGPASSTPSASPMAPRRAPRSVPQGRWPTTPRSRAPEGNPKITRRSPRPTPPRSRSRRGSRPRRPAVAASSATATARRARRVRHQRPVLYLDTSGRVNFAINDGAYRTVTSAGGQRRSVAPRRRHRGRLRHQLFVDGRRVGRDQTPVTTKTFAGYWRIGADQTTGFPNKPSNAALSGSVDEVAVYP